MQCKAKSGEKRSLHVVNEHFEPDFNAAIRPSALCDTVRLKFLAGYIQRQLLKRYAPHELTKPSIHAGLHDSINSDRANILSAALPHFVFSE